MEQVATTSILKAVDTKMISVEWRIEPLGFKPYRIASAGFGLVELMVAMVIGLVGVVVMMQVFSVSEAQKRTTISGDDAISSGAIALHGIQRDIQQSGWGVSHSVLIGCNVSGLVSGGASIPLVPVTINPAGITGDTNTDTLMVIYGNGNGAVEGDLISAQPIAGDPFLSAVSPNVYGVGAAASFNAPSAGPPVVLADRVVAIPATRPTPCSLVATSVTGVNRPNVAVATGVVSMTGGRLYNLGSLPIVRVYAIRTGNLTVCDYMASDCAGAGGVWLPVANNVVSMRAQYGRDTTAAASASGAPLRDAVVDVWDQTTPTTPCAWVRTPALRLALVARSSQPEKRTDGSVSSTTGTPYVTPLAPLWVGNDAIAVAAGASAASDVEIILPSPATSWPKWQDFRYKVFQTTAPFRNVTSNRVVSGC